MEGILSAITAASQDTGKALKRAAAELEVAQDSFLDTGNSSSTEGISLYTLKNHALLSYLHNLIIVVLAQLERAEKGDGPGGDATQAIEELRHRAVVGTVAQRVTLERGVKGLESRISYQIDKMVKSYRKLKADAEEAEKKALHGTGEDVESGDGSRRADSGSNSDSDSDSDSGDEDTLAFKPNPQAMVSAKKAPKASRKAAEEEESGEEAVSKPEKYRPPKISAVRYSVDPDKADKTAHTRRRKVAAMEEYLHETSAVPVAEPSIGSNILARGKYGSKTAADRKKELEIQRYEESNFVRLPGESKKKENARLRKRQDKTFFGEDWSVFEHNNDHVKHATSRKQKSSSVWERTKKRQRL